MPTTMAGCVILTLTLSGAKGKRKDLKMRDGIMS